MTKPCGPRAFKNVGPIELFWITLLRYRDCLAHLNEVRAGGEVSDRVGHDGEQLVSSSTLAFSGSHLHHKLIDARAPAVSHPGVALYGPYATDPAAFQGADCWKGRNKKGGVTCPEGECMLTNLHLILVPRVTKSFIPPTSPPWVMTVEASQIAGTWSETSQR